MNTTLDSLTLYLPHDDMKLLKELTKKFGWKIGRKKKTGMEEAMEDIEKGRVYEVKDIDEYFRKLGVE